MIPVFRRWLGDRRTADRGKEQIFQASIMVMADGCNGLTKRVGNDNGRFLSTHYPLMHPHPRPPRFGRWPDAALPFWQGRVGPVENPVGVVGA